ncbi:hypothetical protein [Yunchengibacter salinarum]|uniref:hypothetical protein n=1 Tax=Yunchengibacter salinarum TaxID=3133399 RepID=UPI0035B5BCB0
MANRDDWKETLPDPDHLPDDDETAPVLDEYPSLKSVAPFLSLATQAGWFRALGERASDHERTLARDYVDMLGFPDAEPVFLADWDDAMAAAEVPDFNHAAWEAEEQLRATLTLEVLTMIDEGTLDMVTAHVQQKVAGPVIAAAEEAADYLRIEDTQFLQALAGAGVQAAWQAALVVMAGGGEEHPFTLRFRLFECGRWPIGVLGRTFSIY